MTEQERMRAQDELNAAYAEYQRESERMAADGRAIGTFSGWAHDRGLIKVNVPKRRGG